MFALELGIVHVVYENYPDRKHQQIIIKKLLNLSDENVRQFWRYHYSLILDRADHHRPSETAIQRIKKDLSENGISLKGPLSTLT